MVDISLTLDILMAFFDLILGVFVLFIQVSFALLGLSQLNLDVSQRVLKLLVLNFAKSEHLTVFNFSSLLAFNSESFTSDSGVLKEESGFRR